MTVAGANMISQSCEIDHSECHCGSGRFVKPGALIRIWGPRTLGLPLVANAESSPSRTTIPLIRPYQCDSEGGRKRGVLLYSNLHIVPISYEILP